MTILRQTLLNRLVHWSIALSTFGLIFTGMVQMPVAKRYGLVDIWPVTGQYWTTLEMHYFLAAVLMFACVWHLTYHALLGQTDIVPKKGDFKASIVLIRAMLTGKEEPPCEKYLPEQRLAWLAFVFAFALIIVTGLLKTYKNLPGCHLSDAMIFWCAQLHNLGMGLIILLIIGHLAAFIFKANRALLPAMFNGRVDAEYVLHRHSLWTEGVIAAKKVVKAPDK